MKSLRGVALALVVMLMGVSASAQLNYGRIYGAITDQTGGALAGATVTVVDVSRGISRPLTADDAGEYSAPSLLPGTYSARAEAAGFKAAEHAGIVVEVGQDLRVDLSLQPGEQRSAGGYGHRRPSDDQHVKRAAGCRTLQRQVNRRFAAERPRLSEVAGL